MMDRIIIKDAALLCNIGVSAKERSRKQKIFADAQLFLDTRKAAKKDDLKLTVNYSDVFNLMKRIAGGKKYNLIETLANDIAERVLDEFKIGKIAVKVKKTLPNMKYAAVWITRKKNG